MQIVSRVRQRAQIVPWVVLLIACVCVTARGQSTDVVAPTAVRTNEVTGSIAARDIGDPRLTDHYYALIGTPGDLLITIDTRNLNGDIDVFTSNGLRPLLKFTVYADSSSPITKGIYFRKQEDLILRVEARTPNDEEGTYRIRFGGSFQTINSGPLLADNPAATVESIESKPTTAKKGRRVSSVGARIEEPTPPEAVAETPTPEPAETVKTAPTRTGSRSKPRRTTSARPKPTKPTAEPATTADSGTSSSAPTTEGASGESTVPVTKPRPSTRRTTARRAPTPRRVKPEPPLQEPEVESGPRLVIETNDGTLIDRYMSTVRRVTVENGQVVVVGKDGKISRVQLANVVRMQISP